MRAGVDERVAVRVRVGMIVGRRVAKRVTIGIGDPVVGGATVCVGILVGNRVALRVTCATWP